VRYEPNFILNGSQRDKHLTGILRRKLMPYVMLSLMRIVFSDVLLVARHKHENYLVIGKWCEKVRLLC
jgi:hypothetical protein